MRCGGLLTVPQWEIFLPVVSLLFAGSMTTKFLTSSQPLCCRFHNVTIGNAGSSKLKQKQLNVLINGKDDCQKKKREFNKLTNREVDSALIYNSGVLYRGKCFFQHLIYCCKIYVSQVLIFQIFGLPLITLILSGPWSNCHNMTNDMKLHKLKAFSVTVLQQNHCSWKRLFAMLEAVSK